MAKQAFSYDIIRFSRQERLPNTFIATEFHPIEGRGGDCVMVTAVEINSPWHHAREFGQQIVNTLVREFVRNQSNSNLMRFEHALKIANHTISQAAEKLGVTIDCAVALFIKDEVHFTVIGQSRLLLFRNNRLTDVTEVDTANPGQFSSVTSGDLAEHEWLMVANRDTVSFLRNQNPTTWEETDSSALAAQLVDQAPVLERNHFFATLVRYRADTVGQTQTVLWDNLEHATPIKLPKFTLPKYNLKPLGEALSKVPLIIRSLTSSLRRRPRPTSAPAFEPEPTAKPAAEVIDFPTRARSVVGQVRMITARLPRINKRAALIAALFLVILFVGYRVVAGRAERIGNEEVAPTILAELTQIPIESRQDFLQTNFSFDRYTTLTDDEKRTFADRVKESGIIFVEPTTVVTQITGEIVALESLGSNLAVIDRTGQLWQIRDGRTVKVEQSVLIQNAQSIALPTNERTVVTDTTGNIWLFEQTGTNQPTALAQPASLGTGAKLVQAYNGNLYVYLQDTKTIYRQTTFDKELSGLRSVGKFDQLAAAVSDWAINSQILGISEQGEIVGLQAGRVAVTGTATVISPPLRLTTIESAPSITTLAGRFVTVSDKGLAGVTKYFLATKAAVVDLATDAADNSLWIGAGDQIYKLTLK